VRIVYPNRTIGTFAGTGFAGGNNPNNWGNNGPAVAAALSNPQGVCVRNDGTVYVVDTNHQRVRVVSQAGIINWYAGGGATYTDNVPPTQSALADPSGCAVDNAGVVYIADMNHDAIRVIPNAGTNANTILTVAGTGFRGITGFNGVAATSAQFNDPLSVAVSPDGQTLYICDTDNSLIRVVTQHSCGTGCVNVNNGIVNDFAGNRNAPEGFSGDSGPATTAQLNNPAGISLGTGSAVLLIADSFNNAVRAVAANGTIYTVAGGSGEPGSDGDGAAAIAALLQDPKGIAVDAAGNAIVADTANNRVRYIGLAPASATPTPTSSMTASLLPGLSPSVTDTPVVTPTSTASSTATVPLSPSNSITASSSPSHTFGASSSVTPASTTTPSPSRTGAVGAAAPAPAPVGAIVGGTVGGLVGGIVIGALAFMAFTRFRQESASAPPRGASAARLASLSTGSAGAAAGGASLLVASPNPLSAGAGPTRSTMAFAPVAPGAAAPGDDAAKAATWQ